MNAQQINEQPFCDNSKYVGEVINDCEIVGYRNRTKQFLLQCTKCGNQFVRNRTTVILEKARCECSKTRSVRHTDGHGDSKLKSVYLNMIDRCYNSNSHAFSDYGGRGISVDTEWLADFRLFMKWALESGYSDGLTLDRKDNDGDYTANNCRWVDRKTQANNRRSNVHVVFDGEILTISQLAEMLGMNYNTLYSKLRKERLNNECK